jgi:signal transduction histidine kinase
VAELAHGALLEMRGSIFDLRGAALTEQGLVAALGTHGEALAVRYDAEVVVDGPLERLPLAPGVEELVFRIGQEAITNAVKHSGGRQVIAEVALEGGNVSLVIRDDGVGFDPARSYGGHLGLELMHSRAVDAGGSLVIESAADAGTAVRLVVPAKAAATTSARAPLAPPVAQPASAS